MIKSHGGLFGRSPVFADVVVEKEIGGKGFDLDVLSRVSESVTEHEFKENPHPQYITHAILNDAVDAAIESKSLDGGVF